MAKTRRDQPARTVTSSVIAPSSDAPAMPVEGEEFTPALFDELQQAGADVPLEIWRVPEAPADARGGAAFRFQTAEWCFDVNANDFQSIGALLTKIRAECGGGSYNLRARKGRSWLINRTVKIAGPARELASPAAPAPAAAPLPAPATDVASVVDAAMRRMTDALAPALQKLNAPPVDPMEQMARVLKLMQEMRQAETAIMPARAPAAPASDPLDELRRLAKMKEVMDSLSGGGGGGGGGQSSLLAEMLKLWETVGKPLVDQLRAQQAAGGGAAPIGADGHAQVVMPGGTTITMPAATAPAPAPTVPPPSFKSVGNDPAAAFGVLLALIREHRGKGTKPEEVALQIVELLNEAPDEIVQQVGEFIDTPNATDWLIGQAPELSESKGWLNAVREEILRLITDSDGEPQP